MVKGPVPDSLNITEYRSFFQIPLQQGALTILLKELLPVEGAAHPSVVPKEIHPPSQARARGREAGWGSRVLDRLHMDFPPGKEGFLAYSCLYVPTSGEIRKLCHISHIECSASPCCSEHVAVMCSGGSRDGENR